MIFIHPANSFAMRPNDPAVFARYHRSHMDTEWQRNLLMDWQYPAKYLQPVERGDRFRFMFKTTPTTGVTLNILDCNKNVVMSIGSFTTSAPPADVTATGQQWTTYKCKAADYSAITADGIYYLELTVGYSGLGSEIWISEPFFIQDTHAGTILIEYTHSENKPGLLFQQLPCRFVKRIDGFIAGYQALSTDTVYQDQLDNTSVLDSIPHRSWKLYAGSNSDGLPDWELDKLNWIFSFDTILLDGKQYTKAPNNAKWAKDGDDDNHPLNAASIEIQEADGQEGFQSAGATLVVYHSPGSYPYALYDLFAGFNIIESAAEIADSTAENSFITNLNTALGDFELLGHFNLTSGVVTYTKGPGDVVNFAGATLLSKRVEFTLNTPGSMGDYTLSMKAAGGTTVARWGDGTVDKWIDNGSYQFPTHAYPGAPATYNVALWYDGLTHFELVDQNSSALTWPNNAPVNLQRLVLQMGSFPSNSFDMADINAAVGTLEKISITHSSLQSLFNLSGYTWPLLAIDFSFNDFASADASGIITATRNLVPMSGVHNGQLALIAQTPPATVSSTAVGDGAYLHAAFNWTVNY